MYGDYMLERFVEWIHLKVKLHTVIAHPPLVSERDLWWVSFGQNIGSEINGKSKVFTRPALILKKLSHGLYLVAPTTTKEKEGSWYVPIKLGGKGMFICLHQVRTVDYRRLFTRLGQIDGSDFKKIKIAFHFLYK